MGHLPKTPRRSPGALLASPAYRYAGEGRLLAGCLACAARNRAGYTVGYGHVRRPGVRTSATSHKRRAAIGPTVPDDGTHSAQNKESTASPKACTVLSGGERSHSVVEAQPRVRNPPMNSRHQGQPRSPSVCKAISAISFRFYSQKCPPGGRRINIPYPLLPDHRLFLTPRCSEIEFCISNAHIRMLRRSRNLH